MSNKIGLITLLIFCCSFISLDIIEKEGVQLNGVKNLHKVTSELYRSGQPNKKGMSELQKMGIATVINLRNSQNDNREAKKTNLILSHIPINAWKMTYEDIVRALKAIQNAKKPVLLHCLHGADRTGATIAAYRMAFENWTKEKAINEFLNESFGFHEKWFPKILNLVQELDVENLKKDLGITSPN